MIKYWIEYTTGEVRFFEAPSSQEAYWYVKMEGDHVLDYGEVEKREASGGPIGWGAGLNNLASAVRSRLEAPTPVSGTGDGTHYECV